MLGMKARVKGKHGKGGGKGKGISAYQGGANATRYFFEPFPERDPHNYRIVKCKAPEFFGCTLLGPNPATNCGWCDKRLDLEAASQGRARQRSRSPGKRSTKGPSPTPKDELQVKYDALLNDRRAVKNAAEIIKVMYGITHTPTPTPAPSAKKGVLETFSKVQKGQERNSIFRRRTALCTAASTRKTFKQWMNVKPS